MASNILPQDAAVLYLRMSSSKQDKSLSAQREELHAYAAKQGYRVLREYVDEAISGDQTEKRTGFLRLREDAEHRRDFGIILVWDEDRLSRNDPLEVGYWLKPIRDAGIVVETPRGRVDWESLGGRLIYLIGQEMRHDFLRTLSRNVARGLLASAKQHRCGTGGASPQGLKGDPDRAAIVRRIFSDYLRAGASLRSVAEGLNRDHIPTPKGKKWSVTTVRYVLRNRKYCGDLVRFRFRAGKYHVIKDGEIVSRGKGDGFEEVEPMIVPNKFEAIIDRKTFKAAQAKMRRQKRDTAPRTGRRYALSGLLRCGDCGLVMCGVPHRRPGIVRSVYRCHTYQDGGKTACYRNQIKEDILLDCIVRMIEREYLSDRAVERFRKRLEEHQAASRKVVLVDTGRLRQRIKDLDRQIDQGAGRIFSAPEGLVGTIYAKLEQLREERGRLQADLQAAECPQDGSGDGDAQEVEEAIEALRNLRQAIREADPEDLRELLRQIVIKVELEFAHRQNGPRMVNELRGGTIFVRPNKALSSLLFTSLGS